VHPFNLYAKKEVYITAAFAGLLLPAGKWPEQNVTKSLRAWHKAAMLHMHASEAFRLQKGAS
jgi:hypothetical protein